MQTSVNTPNRNSASCHDYLSAPRMEIRTRDSVDISDEKQSIANGHVSTAPFSEEYSSNMQRFLHPANIEYKSPEWISMPCPINLTCPFPSRTVIPCTRCSDAHVVCPAVRHNPRLYSSWNTSEYNPALLRGANTFLDITMAQNVKNVSKGEIGTVRVLGGCFGMKKKGEAIGGI